MVTTCPSRVGSPDKRGGYVGVAGDDQVESLLARGLGEHPGHLVQQRPDLEVQSLELEAAGLDLGEVEDLVDQAQQRPAGDLDPGRESQLLSGELGAHQQVVEADHAVEGRPDLVAHGREELRLLPRRLHGLVTRQRQLPLSAFPIGHQGELLGHPDGHRLDHVEAPQRRSGGDHPDGVHLAVEEHRECQAQLPLVPDQAALLVAALGQGQLGRGPRVVPVGLALGLFDVEPDHRRRAVGVGDERPRSLPVVVQEHQVTSLREHFREGGRLVRGAGHGLHEVVLGDLVLERLLAGPQRLDQRSPLGVVEVLVQQRVPLSLGVQQLALAAEHPDDAAVAPHPLHLDLGLVELAVAYVLEVLGELPATGLVEGVEHRQPGQLAGRDAVDPCNLRVRVHGSTVETDDPDSVWGGFDDVPVELREVHVPPQTQTLARDVLAGVGFAEPRASRFARLTSPRGRRDDAGSLPQQARRVARLPLGARPPGDQGGRGGARQDLRLPRGRLGRGQGRRQP